MAAANKFDQFITDLCDGVHKNGVNTGSPTDLWKVYLANDVPSASADSVKTDLAEITNINGYSGPQSINLGRSKSGGTITLTATDVVITANVGSPQGIGPFRYVVLFNDTPVSPLDPLICWWDYGSALTLQSSETFTIDFGATLATIS